MKGIVNTPFGSTLTIRVDWLTSTVTVAGSSRLKRSVFASSKVSVGGVDVDRDRDGDLHVAERIGHGDDDEIAAVGKRRAARGPVPADDMRAEAGLPLEEVGDHHSAPVRRRLAPRRPG